MNQTRTLLLAALVAVLFTGCSPDQEIRLPEIIQPGTPVPTATATITPSPTPPPTPTPVPIQVIHQGERDLANGDWDAAMEAFEVVLADPGATTEEQAHAQLGVARASLKRGDFGSAKAVLDAFFAVSPNQPQAAQAYFLRGEAKLGLSDWSGAIVDFETYLSLRPGLIDSYVFERIADAHLAVGASDLAVAAYDQALAADRDYIGNLRLREKVASVHRSLGSVDIAVAQYQAILGVAENASYRATIEFYIGQAYLEAGRLDEAYAQFDHVVMSYPESYEALSALRALIEADIPVDQFQRGVVNYHQGQYDIAVTAFLTYVAGTPINYPPDAHLYIARSYRQLGNPQAALNELLGLIQRFDLEDSADVYAGAWLELADTYAELGDTETAFATYEQFVTDYPTLPQAADALYEAALLAESLGDTARSITYYQRLSTEYAADPRAPEALFRAGLDAYRAGDSATASTFFMNSASHPANERPARGYLWQGKVLQAAGQTEEANAAFNSAIAADDGEFYGLRADDLLTGDTPFASSGTLNIPPDPEQGRAEAEQWIIQTFGLTTAPPLAETLRADLATDPRMLRARELWDLGLQLEARQIFETVRQQYQDDPLGLYQLAIYFRDIGLYRSSILSAWRLAVLADVSAAEMPVFLSRLRYPTYFSDLILSYSEQHNLDPLWVYALIWQESIFEGFAVSTASAQGLMQIWPPTGEDIAERLQWPGYHSSDLQRPFVSVAFGTWLLRDELDRFDGNQFAALTAYNAGPGNTARWVENAQGDTDLFVESITLAEPKLYVEQIYEHYEMYRALYRTP